MKSARRQYSWEVPSGAQPRINSALVPGGKKTKKGGKISDDLMPPPNAITMGGKKMVDGRGNIIDTNQTIKGGKKGAGFFGDIGNVADSIGSLLGLGKKTKPKKGAGMWNDATDVADVIERANQIKNDFSKTADVMAGKKKKGGSAFGSAVGDDIMTDLATDAMDALLGDGKKKRTKKGAGIFGDIGNAVDSVGSLLGLGKKTKKGGANGDSFVGVKSPDMVDVNMGGKKTKKGAGIFGDIGNAVDSVGSLLGLGKKTKKGGIQSGALTQTMGNSNEHQLMASGKKSAKEKRAMKAGEIKSEIEKLEAGIKCLKKMVKKVK